MKKCFGAYLGVRLAQKVLVLSSERVAPTGGDPHPLPLPASLKHILGKYAVKVEGKVDSSNPSVTSSAEEPFKEVSLLYQSAQTHRLGSADREQSRHTVPGGWIVHEIAVCAKTRVTSAVMSI